MSNFQEIHCTYIYLNKHSVKQKMHNNNKNNHPQNLGEEKERWYYTEEKSS